MSKSRPALPCIAQPGCGCPKHFQHLLKTSCCMHLKQAPSGRSGPNDAEPAKSYRVLIGVGCSACAQQEEREWEEEVDAARRLAAELAEQKRQEKEAAEDAADGATTVDEEDQPLGAAPYPLCTFPLLASIILLEAPASSKRFAPVRILLKLQGN